MDGMIRKHVVVRGQVQGVGFRYSTSAEATRLGLTGFVRNTLDGAVEAEIEGDAASVARMLEWLAAGPPWARVESVDVAEVDVTDADVAAAKPSRERGFQIRS